MKAMFHALKEKLKAWFSPSYDHLPPIHRPDGERPFQEDWWIYKKFGIKIPRWVCGRPMVHPPKVIWGSDALRFNHVNPAKNEDVGVIMLWKFKNELAPKFPWPEWGPKPYQDIFGGAWYIAICYPEIFGVTVPLPCISITFSNRKALRLGVRWSEGPNERYYQLLGGGTKDLNEEN